MLLNTYTTKTSLQMPNMDSDQNDCLKTNRSKVSMGWEINRFYFTRFLKRFLIENYDPSYSTIELGVNY